MQSAGLAGVLQFDLSTAPAVSQRTGADQAGAAYEGESL